MKHTTKAATQTGTEWKQTKKYRDFMEAEKNKRYFTTDTPIPAESCLFGWDVEPGGLFKGAPVTIDELQQGDPVIVAFKGKNGGKLMAVFSEKVLTANILIGRVVKIEDNDYMGIEPMETGTDYFVFRTRTAKLYRLLSYQTPGFDPNAKEE